MNVEIILYQKRGTKKDLLRFAKENNFEKSETIFRYSKSSEEYNFVLFEKEDYKSISGVELRIVKSTKEEREKYNCAHWILYTRTTSIGTRIDKQRQNDIIKSARKIYGGSFYNDWYGTNRYTNLKDYKKLSAPERGLYLLYENLHSKLGKVRACIREYENPMDGYIETISNDKLKSFLKTRQPSAVLYNSLLPFAVSIIEHFFGEAFRIMIKYDENSKNIIEKENIKVPLRDVLMIEKGELSIESIISREFTFQNLNHVNKAFKKYLTIDINNTLSVQRKVRKRRFFLRDKLEDIILRRHKMIHHFAFDETMTKDNLTEVLDVIEICITTVAKHIEKERNWCITEESVQ